MLPAGSIASAAACQALCVADATCAFFTWWHDRNCYLATASSVRQQLHTYQRRRNTIRAGASERSVAGPRECSGVPRGTTPCDESLGGAAAGEANAYRGCQTVTRSGRALALTGCGSTMERSGMGCSSLLCRALASAAWPPGTLLLLIVNIAPGTTRSGPEHILLARR